MEISKQGVIVPWVRCCYATIKDVKLILSPTEGPHASEAEEEWVTEESRVQSVPGQAHLRRQPLWCVSGWDMLWRKI